jgi:hypothetical protein
VLGAAIVAAALVVPHAVVAGGASDPAPRSATRATAAAQRLAADRHACVVRYRRVLPAAAAAMAAQAVLAACGGEHVAAMKPWLSPVPYFAPREPAASAARTTPPTTATGKPRSTAKAVTTGAAPDASAPGSGAPSDAEVAAELRQAFKGGGADGVDTATLTADALATVPVTAPSPVAAIIQAGNQVAYKPYVYGGGHGGGPEGVFTDSAYDCSGSVSYALASAGLVKEPMVSGALARWGAPGPGKWVTIYANGGHAFMVVAGLRFDTSGRSARGSRWQATARSVAGFTVRHPPGL